MDNIHYNTNPKNSKKHRKKWDKININTYIKPHVYIKLHDYIRKTRLKWDINRHKKIIFFLHYNLKPKLKKKIWKY